MSSINRSGGRPQSQRNSTATRSADALGLRGKNTHNKDRLGSEHDRTMAAHPTAHFDEFGSRHNQDQRKDAQKKNIPAAVPTTPGQPAARKPRAPATKPARRGARRKESKNDRGLNF